MRLREGRCCSAWRDLVPGRRRAPLEEKATKLFAELSCEPVPTAAGDQYVKLKAAQQRRGLPLDENDLWIAAIAIVMNAAIVSRDSDFRAIEDLRVVEP